MGDWSILITLSICSVPSMVSKGSESALARYRELLELGVSKEVARAVLPLNIYSEMYDTCNLWNWTRFLKLRLAREAQFEIRAYARVIYGILREIFPVSIQAFAGPEEWPV